MELMETYVIEYVTNVTRRAMARSQRSGYNTLMLRDLLKVIEEDDKKFLRVPYFLTMLQAVEKLTRYKTGDVQENEVLSVKPKGSE
eukprot:CAMPEP_0202961650 /NCGR_PEP_ID=MMETSP1396-20130829/5726_1 /ASSEMBLY_ACC=CAM_ASM_000872 /TAXON_ID= /ORGANISM="Pseudokeronopsis sp., Strain Brazil" /LENGTH=85 /DNA_ID=CAMNT_0049681641 /DNA_START=160 /DNA_END=415 /DNA_ORIENTATION=+